MPTKEIFEECIRFVSELENQESELDVASKMDIAVEDDQLSLMVIQKLERAIKLVEEQSTNDNKAKLLYYIALYANAIGKPSYGISLCYIVINEPATTDKYRDLAKQLLNEIKLKLPEDMYNEALHKTTLDIRAALRASYKWLTQQERHASQPATKHVFNSDLIKNLKNKNARN